MSPAMPFGKHKGRPLAEVPSDYLVWARKERRLTMTGFLVIGRCIMDDVPLRLCATAQEAREFASVLNEGDVIAEAADVLNVGVSDVIGVDIVEFRDGAPVARQVCKDFDLDWL
jgi:hypothetical protein